MHKVYCFREDKTEFGKNLKSLMISNKITIEALAYEIGYDVNTINKWRAGQRVPKLEDLKKLSELFETTIQKLYLPNSFYEKKLSKDLIDFIQEKREINQTDYELLTEYIDYNMYLSQKMMFSFLSPREKKDYKSMFRYYIITSYGKEKLSLNEMTFDEFHDSFKKYIREQYGASLPYKITLKDSIELIQEFNKIVKIKYVKEDVCL